ncbi:PAS domain-containing protein [Limimaricola soesokkakensis]|uniref:PAS domain-containing protein n=1 Tax=Limimaricola soesokkakensis TaxID=1343159 RepID=UPI0035174467
MEMRDETVPAGDDAAARLAQLERYWRSLALRGLPPSRDEIDPDRIGAALPGAFVLDRIAPGQARLRVAGRALCEIVGTEARGLPLSRLFRRTDHMRLAALLERCFAELHPCRVPLLAEGEPGQIGGLALLPLRQRLGAAPQMIGALLHDLPPGRARRFGLAGPARIGAPPVQTRDTRTHLRLVVSNEDFDPDR